MVAPGLINLAVSCSARAARRLEVRIPVIWSLVLIITATGGLYYINKVKLAMDKRTSWQGVAKKYSEEMGKEGDFYHQKVILPNLLRLLGLNPRTRLLDLACGEGILARSLPPIGEYLGLDAAFSLIDEARKKDEGKNHFYGVADICKELPIRKSGFDRAVMVLSLQNLRQPFKAIRNAARQLKNGGKLVLVINHPSFRIPQNSGWGVDRVKNVQYRKIESYMSWKEILIESNPFNRGQNIRTYSYHYPLSVYSEMIADNGFLIERIEEWVSPKKSEGVMAKVEDRARAEFPLFMAMVAKKV